ncbi:MAG: PAS domain S-box protein [Bacteroidia bacterium]|nr:PAS domain S-box protein [Bacteroidia bacterium]MCX7651699.1 PAS domain S-box protein [Bacteroidia bacterium]MDW8417431.1 PAS domain S-box protein [Bacteroidia bacterium]
MRRWNIADYLGFGLAILVAVVGGSVLGGIWIITQRDAALMSGSAAWENWDRALYIWAYVVLLILLGVLIGLALWWWARLARPVLHLRERLRRILWEGITETEPPPPSPSETSEIVQIVDELNDALNFIHQLLRRERQTVPPTLADWPPVLQGLCSRLAEQFQQNHFTEKIRTKILNSGQTFLRLGQQSLSVEGYLAKAGPLFIETIGAAMGAFYKVEGEYLRRLYSYAYPLDAPEKFLLGEGWIGQVAREGRPLWLPSLPQGYMQALSGLGKAPPQAVAVLPVIAADSIRGVWDVASFTEWDAEQQTLAEAITPFFAVGYFLREEAERESSLASERAALKAQIERLENQSAYYQKLNQDLRYTLELIEQRASDTQANYQHLEKQLVSLRSRWEAIVGHLQEAIVFFDSTGRPRYLSPATRRLLGYSEEELQVFFRPVERMDAEPVRQYFQSLLSTHTSNGQPQTLRFRYHHKDGRLLWLEATGRNYLSHPGIEAVLLILRDVTEEIEYEKQYRTRLKFQSLVENSPDIIFRTDREGHFLYVNPTIEKYTGYSPAHYIRNTIYSVGFSLDEVRFWSVFIDKLFSTLSIQSAEIDFPSVYGMRKMAVRGIPEVGPDGEVETMVILLQDITELRQVQEQLHHQNLRLEQARQTLEVQKQELEEKNRDIMESITYARRIQGALLPGEEGLRAIFPDSFVLHWLRDVVGGDFYWCGEAHGQRIVAVVDCTGHGVPGAFMTFLGYTLIESAIRERGITDPAEILYYMDARLRQLLSSQQEAMQDGMDLVICSIDPERRIVRFAGAHRPLFVCQQGRWNLLSGAPTGLGGALWLDKLKNFTTHTFSYQSGDLLYLYTDGYIDQFDTTGQRRYSHRRFREFIATWAHLPMREQHTKLLEELSGWMGENSPTDDITVVGLRL